MLYMKPPARRCHLMLRVSTFGLALVLATAAHAQDANNGSSRSEGAQDQEGSWIQDIVVTARKREESMQEVPISVTAFSAEQLAGQRVLDIKNLGEITPGLISAGDKQRGFPVIRGITTRSPNAGAEGAVGQYVDEVYQPRFSNQLTALLDLERVEVLKGPQGTLFGRNTVAGAINYVTKKPGNDTEASLSAGLGNYNLFEIRGSVSGPLAQDKLAAGLSFMALSNDGSLKGVNVNNQVIGDDGRSDYGVRGTLRWTPSDSFEANLSAMRVRTKSAQIELTEGNPSGPTAPPLVRLRLYTPSTFVADYRDYRVGMTDVGTLDRTADQYTLRTDWNLSDDLTLTTLTAYQRFKQYLVVDADIEVKSIATTTSREHSDTFSQEIRLAGDGDVFRWNVGANYFYDDHYRSDDADLTTLPAPFAVHIFSSTDVKTTSYAVFGQGYLSPVEGLTITAGARYSYDERDYRKISRPGNASFGDTYDSELVPAWNTNPHWDAITWTGAIDYKFDSDKMIYASVSRGYRSGGIQGRAQTLITAMANYGPEYVTQYEVGAKTEFFDHRLQLNVSGYYIPYRDVQVSQAQITTFFGGAAIQNAASARVKGIEAEAKLQLGRGLRLELGYAYNDAHFRSYQASDNIPASIAAVRGCPAVYGCIAADYIFDGSPFEFAPKHAVTAAANYQVETAGGFKLKFRGEYNWKSKFLLNTLPASYLTRTDDFLEAKFLQQPAYGLLNAFFTIDSPDDHWSVSFWGRNLADKRYLIQGSDPRTVGNGQFSKFVYGDRRTYGVNVTWRL
ncbi:TonB-dependent receptor [Sphingobium chungangianum]